MTDTATRINELTTELLLMHPHLTPSRAYQIVLERDPELALRHYHGDDGIVHDEPVAIREVIPDPVPSTRADPAAMTHYADLDPDMQWRYRPGGAR